MNKPIAHIETMVAEGFGPTDNKRKPMETWDIIEQELKQKGTNHASTTRTTKRTNTRQNS